MKIYHEALNKILTKGTKKKTRAVDSEGNELYTISYTGITFEHDLRDGFPLLTTRKMPFKSAVVEMEGFTKGITDKKWYQDRKCKYWDEWCNPQKIPSGLTTKERIDFMKTENDLGRIYGSQWREWNNYFGFEHSSLGVVYSNNKIDQLKEVMNILKKDPCSRRMVVTAYNPTEINSMALPPCHTHFQILSDGEFVDLTWYQRSCDFILGSNIVGYALLCHLIAQSVGLKARKISSFYADAHIYSNQIESAKELLNRPTDLINLPTIEINPNVDIFNWTHEDVKLLNYTSLDAIKIPLAI